MLTSYNAKDTTITVDNVFITGLGEDMVTGEKSEDLFEYAVGAQGDVIKNEINNDTGEVTITIQPTSPQKPFLMSLSKRKTAFPLWVTNKALKERFGGSQANLKSYPSMERGAQAGDMEFVFGVADYTVENI